MATARRSRLRQTALWRIALIAAVFAIGVTIYRGQELTTSRDGRRIPHMMWQEMIRQQLLQPDLLLRMSLFSRQLQARTLLVLPPSLDPDALYDRAVAGYETLVLEPHNENPYASYRLGIIYGLSGYPDHAQPLFLHAAELDVENEALYLALARLFSPHQEADEDLTEILPYLQSLPKWLADLTVPHYYSRLAQLDAARSGRSRTDRRAGRPSDRGLQVQRQAAAHQWRFGMRALLLGLVVLVLLLVSLSVLLTFLWRGIFDVPRRSGLSHAPVPWRVPWRLMDIAEVLAVLFLSLLAVGLAAGLIADRLEQYASNPPIRAALVAIQYFLVMLIALRLMMWRVRATGVQKLSVLGLRGGNRTGVLILSGMAGYSVFLSITLLQSLINQSSPLTGPVMQLGMRLLEKQDPLSALLYLALLGLAAPLLEELIFRGFIYGGLRRYLPPFTAVLISAGAFALMHLNPAALLQLTIIGVILAVLYERSRSIIPCLICHAMNNILAFTVILLANY